MTAYGMEEVEREGQIAATADGRIHCEPHSRPRPCNTAVHMRDVPCVATSKTTGYMSVRYAPSEPPQPAQATNGTEDDDGTPQMEEL